MIEGIADPIESEGRPAEDDGRTRTMPPGGTERPPQWPGWAWERSRHGRGPWGRHHRRWAQHLQGRGPLRRSRDDRLVAGVAGGLAERIGIDATLVRIGLVLLGLASGVGLAAYVLAWLLLPVAGQTSTIASRAVSDLRGLALVLALVPLLVLTLLVGSAIGVGYVNSLAWPVFLSAAGAVLIWRNAEEEERAWVRQTARPLLRLGSEPSSSRRFLVVRLACGALLLAAGLVVLVLGHTSTSLLRPAGGTALVIAAFVVLFGPWWLRIARELVSERQARVRAEERADMASRVHDSVLQTLAMIQRSSDDPRRVVQLARAQERELRSWLFDGRLPGSFGDDEASTLAAGVQLIEHEVEETHGVAVEAVTVGDCLLDDELRALLAAGREGTVNAAKWSGEPVVSLFAEVEPDRVTLFVRDRGKGFDPHDVAVDRRGIAESIRARMTRHGGTATVRSAPGAGTEVELSIPRRRGGA